MLKVLEGMIFLWASSVVIYFFDAARLGFCIFIVVGTTATTYQAKMRQKKHLSGKISLQEIV